MLWSIARDPFADLRRLQREMNSLFSEFTASGESFPAMNVWSNEEGAQVQVLLPGLKTEDIEVSVKGDVLTVQGKRDTDEGTKDAVVHRAERGNGTFIRTLRLPFEVEAEKVSARYADGVLALQLPRAEASKARRIAIES